MTEYSGVWLQLHMSGLMYNVHHVCVYVHICVCGERKRLVLGWVVFRNCLSIICCVRVSHLYSQTIHVADQFVLGFLAGCHTCSTDGKHEQNTHTIANVNFLFVWYAMEVCLRKQICLFQENLIDAIVMLELIQLVTLYYYHFFMLACLCSIPRCQITNFVFQPPEHSFEYIHVHIHIHIYIMYVWSHTQHHFGSGEKAHSGSQWSAWRFELKPTKKKLHMMVCAFNSNAGKK